MLRRLTLVGYRGCGKTTVGRLAAAALGWPFIDLDQEISAASGKSIAAIFAGDGEAAFRERESEALATALAGGRELVLSTGGGCVLREGNRDVLRARGGLVAYLETPVAVLQSRLRADATARPSLTGRPPADEVAEVLALRAPLYRVLADAILAGDRAPEALASELARLVENTAKAGRKPGVA
jgi:shikimate kinase